MSLNNTSNSSLIRTEQYAPMIKELFKEELLMDTHVRWVTGDFPDGDNLNIPTASELSATDRTPGATVKLQDPQTSNFVLTGFTNVESGFAVPDEFREDSWYVNNAISIFVKEIAVAIMRRKDSDIANLHTAQTASDPNTINGIDHRYVATGTNQVITTKDIQKANLALDKSKVPTMNRKMIVDPFVVYQLLQVSDYLAQDVYGTNAHLAGSLSGRRGAGSVAGFQIETGLNLDSGISETIVATAPTSGSKSVTTGIANMCLGEEAFIGAMRTEPTMKQWRDEDTQSDVYYGRLRYAVDLYRQESLVTILTDAN